MCWQKVVEPQTRLVELPIANLPQGVYFITLTTPSYTAMQKLLVKRP
ncbi:MAG: T9SS type A sorting domain-containing protein [Bacteroidales bacterium]|nr:T9SS type A sorting domain-containing protein [Bacteroidales bacterium]